MVVGLLGDADGLLQGQVCLVAEEEQTAVFPPVLTLGCVWNWNSLVSEAAVQTGQVESGVAEAPPVAVVPVALAFVSR